MRITKIELNQFFNSLKNNGIKSTTGKVLQRIKTEVSIPGEFRNLPRELQIETTTLCNLNCEYCVLKTNTDQRVTMELSQFKLFKPYFKYMHSISLSGLAEPLMNKRIADFIRYIKSENGQCSVSTVSNATLLTERICHELVEARLDGFGFSLDGTDAWINDKIRKGSSISNILENIKLLNEIKKREKSRVPGLSAITVLQNKNYRQLPKIVETISELGVRTLTVNGLEPYTEDLVDNVLWYPPHTPTDLPDILEESIELAKRKGVTIELADYSPAIPSCPGVNIPLIMPNGDVTACAVLAYDRDSFFSIDKNNQIIRAKKRHTKRTFGNVFEESLPDIWNKKEYATFRQNVLNKHFPEECKGCLLKHNIICPSGTTSSRLIISQVREQLHACSNSRDTPVIC